MPLIELSTLLPALILFSFTASITPGPNNILLTYSGSKFGIKKTLPHIVGIRAGMTIIHIMMLMGLGHLVLAIPPLHFTFKLLASGYIVYLACKIAFKHTKSSQKQQQAQPLSFMQGALFQLINPKSMATLLSLTTALTLPGEYYWHSAILGVVVFNIVALGSGLSWIYFGKVLSNKLQNPAHMQRFNYAMASLLLACLPLIHLSAQ
ncbi:LysE family translocator [Pseudoalteromonas luteoviolacea]|uniref:LysE family translocator n=1 Tax=Pseudoalteromonas luteoviolacea TaxID=43657 RepID=UPI001B36126E|nr:LysE family translocator [Pseudoalteromonas luteoviolacea]MBQ4876162.1 LysE family translocator [Pseudoalteromonas luteoviolacea]MBQ4905797.1 LysE family translocator [Pseudoalteromonas luteoviolacea]